MVYNMSMRWTAATVLFVLALAPAGVCAASSSFARLPSVILKQPTPGARLRTYFPILSATVQRANANSLHLFVDGQDVTTSASVSAGRLQYVPRDRMRAGWHDVFVEGTGKNNRPFSDSWVFQTETPDGTWASSPADGFEFFPGGGSTFFPGNFMHFFLIAPSDGFAVLQLCGLGQFPFEHQPFSPVFFITVPVPVATFNPFLNCQVAALFTPLDGFDTVFVPLPDEIDIFSNRRQMVMRRTTPVYRAPEQPVVTAPSATTFTGRTTIPIYRAQPLPGMYRAQPLPGTYPVQMPQSAAGPPGMPPAVRPITVPHPISVPHPVVPIPH